MLTLLLALVLKYHPERPSSSNLFSNIITPSIEALFYKLQDWTTKSSLCRQTSQNTSLQTRRTQPSAPFLSFLQLSNKNTMGSNPRVRYVTADGGPPMGGQPPQAPTAPFSPPPPPYSASILAIPPRPDYGYVEVRWNPAWPMQPAPPPLPTPAAPAPRSPPSHSPQPTTSSVISKLPRGMQLDGTYIGFPDGSNYLFPAKHTILHVVAGGYHPWDNPGTTFGFTRHKVASMMTVRELLGQLGSTGGGDDKNGITECIECGDGAWIKGSTFFKKDDKSKQTLEALGWDESRGTDRKPVWLALHKG